VGVNAYRNIHVFGMDTVEYRDAYYEGFGGHLNREDIPTDRFLVSWDLKKEVHRPDYDWEVLLETGHNAIKTNVIHVAGKKGQVDLDEIESLQVDINQEFVLVEIPVDFYTMIWETDVLDKKIRRIPLDWRLKTRKVFHELLAAGFEIIDFCYFKAKDRARDFYVLKRST
jgi:predicted GNAT superfamily acetyltransferase